MSSNQVVCITDHLKLLGHRVQDRVSGLKGVVASVSFDLYGCVQAVVTPSSVDKDGKLGDSHWLDIKRLEVTSDEPVIEPPSFAAFQVPAADIPGGFEKPLPR